MRRENIIFVVVVDVVGVAGVLLILVRTVIIILVISWMIGLVWRAWHLVILGHYTSNAGLLNLTVVKYLVGRANRVRVGNVRD